MAAGEDFDVECFFITRIGKEGSAEREQSDGVLAAIVDPACRQLGLIPQRADSLPEPGQITSQVIEHLMKARAVVADLSGGNPNVYYELAIRHAFRLPVALLAEQGTRLPFDTSQMRTIFYVPDNYKSGGEARNQLVDHLGAALDGAVDSPVTTTIDLQSLREGGVVERQLVEVVTSVDNLAREMQEMALDLRDLTRARAEVNAQALRDLQIVSDAFEAQLSEDAPPLDVEYLSPLLRSVNRHLQEEVGSAGTVSRSRTPVPSSGDGDMPTVVDLMEALRASVDAARKSKTAGRKPNGPEAGE